MPIVEDIMIFSKCMDSGPSCDWTETDRETAEWLMSNLRCYRDGWANGFWHVAVGYGRVVWEEKTTDRWFVSPWFTSKRSRLEEGLEESSNSCHDPSNP